MSAELLIEQRGTVLHITINRPDAGNGMSDEMVAELTATIERAHEKAELVLLRGAGKDFCVGWERKADAAPFSSEAITRRAQYDPVFDCYWAIRSSPVPVIGAIQGRAMGFGIAVVSLCDVSFAADTATFNIPEMTRNVMPTIVLSALYDRMNRNAILWMTYSSDFIDAKRALEYGLVSTVVPAAQLDQEVGRFCDYVGNQPRAALRGLKEYLRVAPAMDPHAARDYARSLHAVVNTAAEMKRKR
jgi:enoyl-CoA hydratase